MAVLRESIERPRDDGAGDTGSRDDSARMKRTARHAHWVVSIVSDRLGVLQWTSPNASVACMNALLRPMWAPAIRSLSDRP